MNFFNRLFRKESAARMVSVRNVVGRPLASPANYESFAKKGFNKNAVVYSCISKIAKAAGGIEWLVYKKQKRNDPIEMTDHPLLKLWSRPNPMMATGKFVENVVGYYLLTGNTYTEAFRPTPLAPPLELWPVRPDKMKVVPGANGYPMAYEYSDAGVIKRWEVDFVKLNSDILHVKTFNPINDWYGLSPLEAALLSLDQNNSAALWNLAMLQNSATPSGVLKVETTDANPTGKLTDDQFERLKEELDGRTGAANAGRPLLLEGGLEWTQISLSPKDMEWLRGKEVSASDIAMVYGVPLEILGLGQKTFQNYKEARLAFYEETVLPTLDTIKEELNRWLGPAFGEDVYLDYNKDDIEALAIKREAKFISLANVNFLTQNEKREAVGYTPADGMDVFVIGSQIIDPNAPEVVDPSINEEEAPLDPNDPNAPKDPEDNEDEEIEEDPTDDQKGWKSFNLVNANEKRQSWRRQNARKKRLVSSFERDLLEDFRDMVKGLIRAGTGIADPKLQEFSMLKAIDDFTPNFERTISRHIKITLDDFGVMVLDEGKSIFNLIEKKANRKYESFAVDYTKKRTGEAITTIQNSTRKKIKDIMGALVQQTIEDGLTNEELTNEIVDWFEPLSKNRARVIAKTEVQLAANNGSREAVKSLQIPGMRKEWVPNSPDGRNRDGEDGGPDHLAMAGVVIDLDDKFNVPPGVQMDGPGDPSAGADQVIQCRCALVYKAPKSN